MPIVIPTAEAIPLSRRSGEDLSGGSGSTPSILMVETLQGFDFPELEGKEPQQQVR